MSQVITTAYLVGPKVPNIFIAFNLEKALEQAKEIVNNLGFSLEGTQITTPAKFEVEAYGGDYRLLPEGNPLEEVRYTQWKDAAHIPAEDVQGLPDPQEYTGYAFKLGSVKLEVGEGYFRIIYTEGYGHQEYETSRFPFQMDEAKETPSVTIYSLVWDTDHDTGSKPFLTEQELYAELENSISQVVEKAVAYRGFELPWDKPDREGDLEKAKALIKTYEALDYVDGFHITQWFTFSVNKLKGVSLV